MASPRYLSRCVCVSCTGVWVLVQPSLLGFSTSSPLDPAPPSMLCASLSLFHIMTNTPTPARAARSAAFHLQSRQKHTQTHPNTRGNVMTFLSLLLLCVAPEESIKGGWQFACVSVHICAGVCDSECVSPG